MTWDPNRAPDRETPLWSETRWNGCFNPDEGVGLFLHAGRFRGDLDWWWAQTVVYLPGGELAVERSWVRDPGPTGVRTASLDLRAEDQGWSARFDGIAQRTSTRALATAARGSSAPSVHVTFDVAGDASRPLWDMSAGAQDFADAHVEQVGRSTGTLAVGGRSYRLDGVAYHDHSSGPRDWRSWGGHHFAVFAMPDLTVHHVGIYTPDGALLDPIGVWMREGEAAAGLAHAAMPRLQDLLGAPHAYDLDLQPEDGPAQRFRVEILHAFPATITVDNDNINGIDWDLEGDPIVLVECQARFTAEDGTVGHGHLERSMRRSAAPRQAL